MNVMIYGNWRTGTNLLLGIFEDLNFFSFAEYYTTTGTMDNPTEIRLGNSNKYLVSLILQLKNHNCVIKVPFAQRKAVNDRISNIFETKIVIYRKNILQSAISRIIALKRKSFVHTDDLIQTEFNDRIEIDELSSVLNKILSENNLFINNLTHQKINHVVNYEDDLVPYFKYNRTIYKKSDNYTITNHDELIEWYNQSDYTKHFNLVNSYYDNLKSTVNTADFSDYINSIKTKAQR